MSTTAIETALETEVLALLNGAGLTAYRRQVQDDTPLYPAVAVECAPVSDDLPGGSGPLGVYRAVVTCDCQTYLPDDLNATALRTLLGQVRTALMLDDLAAVITAAASDLTIHGWDLGASDLAAEGQIRHGMISLTFHLSASQTTTTTTT